MTRSRLPLIALLALALPLLPACGDDGATSSEPDLNGLDPLAAADSVDALREPLAGVREVGDNFLDAFEDLRDAGVQYRRVAGAGPAAVTFPPEHLGATFRYEPSEGGWVVDESRTGAPADGVRVLWYQLDGGGGVAQPIQERGYIDLTDGTDGSLEQIDMHAVETRTSADDVTLLDFVQGYAVSATTASFEASGSYSDGGDPVGFEIDSEESAGGSGQQYAVSVTLERGASRYGFEASGSGSPTTGGSDDDIRATVEIGGDRTVLDIAISGVGPNRTADGTLSHNGTAIALVEADGTVYGFTDPDGDSFPPTTVSQLNVLVRALLLSGLEPLTRLPLLLP